MQERKKCFGDDEDKEEDEGDEDEEEEEDKEDEDKCSPETLYKMFNSIMTLFDKLKKLNKIIILNDEKRTINECFKNEESFYFDLVKNIQVDLNKCTTRFSTFDDFINKICQLERMNHALIKVRVNQKMSKVTLPYVMRVHEKIIISFCLIYFSSNLTSPNLSGMLSKRVRKDKNLL